MKTARRLMLVLLFCIALVVSVHSVAYAETIASGTCGAQGDNLTWTLYDDGELAIEGSGDMAWFGQGSPWSNYSNQITKLTIGNGVTRIGDFAFLHCRMTDVTIPAGVVSIGYRAFGYCPNLTSIMIPASVTSIESEVFLHCENLSEIQVSPENTAYVAVDGVLYTTDMKTLLRCPSKKTGNVIIPNGVIYIEPQAFCECSNLTAVSIPEGVETIGQEAFFKCTGLTEITLPNSLSTIGPFAFQHCHSLTSVTIPAGVTNIEHGAFSLCENLIDFIIDSNNTEFCTLDGAIYTKDLKTLVCYACGRTGNLTIPNGVERIEKNACHGNAITSVIIPEGVTEIGWAAFTVSSLSTATIPKSVTKIYDYAFNCRNLTDVYYGGSVEQWDAIVIGGVANDPLFSAKIHFADQAITISYDANGGNGTMEPQAGEKGKALTLPPNTFTNGNLVFSCWNTNADGSGTAYAPGDKITPTDDMTLYAQWAEAVEVWYYPGEANGSAASVDTPKGVNVKLPRPTEFGFTAHDGEAFAGWLIEGDDTLYKAGDEVTFTNTKRVTAQWAKKITVSYYKNDETPFRFVTSAPSNNAFNLRTLAQLEEIAQINGKTFLREGYEFVGWSLTPDAAPDDPGIIQDGAEVTFEDNTSLYAIWREEDVHWCPVSFMISTESTGTGTVVMKYGNTQLTASSQIKDSNGNIIIKGNGTNAWLVRDGADVCINLMVNAAYNCNGYISLNDGDFSFITGVKTIRTFSQPTQYAVAFIRVSSTPKSDYCLSLPASLTAVEEDAFAGGAFSAIDVPEQVSAIGSRAFADCPNLNYIVMHGSETEFAPDAFENVEGLTIFGKFDSTAAAFAKEHGFTFTPIA